MASRNQWVDHKPTSVLSFAITARLSILLMMSLAFVRCQPGVLVRANEQSWVSAEQVTRQRLYPFRTIGTICKANSPFEYQRICERANADDRCELMEPSGLRDTSIRAGAGGGVRRARMGAEGIFLRTLSAGMRVTC